MRGARTRHFKIVPARVRAAVAVAAIALVFAFCAPLFAFAAGDNAGAAYSLPFPVKLPQNEKMLVESDQLVYDYDHQTVSAVGNVKIYYGGYTLEADNVTYNKQSGRLIASGHVALTDPSGISVYSDYIDITDDFRDGFVQSLRVDTPERTHFAAARAERSGGDTTTFFNGVYTACEPCKEHPEKPLTWNVKAQKIVVDHKAHMIYFSDASLEFFGLPMAWLPYFSIADPSVKRKTGFLIPSAGYNSQAGFFLSTPYFWALAPDYDVTLTPTVFSQQGFLGEAQWRQRLANGTYQIDAAGIDQRDPAAFAGLPGDRTFRGAIRTSGQFDINQDWTFGWDGTLMTDRAFTRDYQTINTDPSEADSTAYLTGLRDRNYFNAQTSYYQILTNQAAGPEYDQSRQGWAAPVIDYQRVADNPILGGEVTYTGNLQNIVRPDDDPFTLPSGTYYYGTAGDTTRLTNEVEWRKQIIGPLGQVITPFASLRGDAFFLGDNTSGAPLTTDPTAFEFMPAIGATWSLPVLITAGGSTHVIEPIAQIIVRPNATGYGALPNNDAQSLVFDTSNLFSEDKFSGFDRVEGGTRANLGLHYLGTFANGGSVDGTVGQSIQLAGANPFAAGADPVSDAGAVSGLETKFSDYVAGVTVNSGLGPQFDARARFDNADLSLNRGELDATAALGAVTGSASYLYLRANPAAGLTTTASMVRGSASVNFAQNWRAFGSLTYDVANSALAGDSFGIAFDNECLTVSVAYTETRLGYTDLTPSQWLNFRLQLRTFGEADTAVTLAN